MAYKFPNSGKSRRVFNIERFRGVDFASQPFEVSAERSPDAVNLIPSDGGWPETRPGISRLVQFAGRINGIHELCTGTGKIRLVHHGSKISHWQSDGSSTLLYESAADTKSSAVQLRDKLLIFDGKAALVARLDDEGAPKICTLAAAAYVPTTMIGRPAGAKVGGTALEAVNMVGSARKNSFCVSSEGQTVLYMDTRPVKAFNKAEVLLQNGIWTEVDWESSNLTEGSLTFETLNVTPVSGMDNYRVEFEAETLGDEDRESRKTPGEADLVEEEGVRVWLFSSGNEIWAKKYWFEIGTSLPRESVDVAIMPADTYYSWSTDYTGKAYPGQYAVTVTESEGAKAVTLGFLSDGYGEDEDPDELEIYTDVELVKDDGVWYVTVTQPHNVCGSGSGHRVYVRDLSRVVLSWREGEVNLQADKINGCTAAHLFGVGGNADRIFVTGNVAHKNMDWMSGFEDAAYWPEDGYTRVGSEGSAVVGYSWLADGVLAIHKEEAAGDSTIWYRAGGLDSEGEARFTLTQGAVGVGAASARCFAHFGADNLLLAKDGVYAITHAGNEAVNERYAQLRSWFVNPKLTAEKDLGEAVAIRFGGRYYLAVNGHVYVADTGEGSTWESRGGGYQYDWWYWEGVPVRVWYAGEDELMFGTAGGWICRLTGENFDEGDEADTPISCHWLTPVLDFGTRAQYKKIKNAYAIAEPYARSAVRMAYIISGAENEVLASEVLDRRMSVFDFDDIDFEDFAFETDPMPRNVPSGAKAKKVMFMQFKLYNEPGRSFGLYGLTVLYTVGGKYRG